MTNELEELTPGEIRDIQSKLSKTAPSVESQKLNALNSIADAELCRRERCIRAYMRHFEDDMSDAEMIGALRKLVETGFATDTEIQALIDLVS